MRVGDSTTTPASEVKNLGIWFDRQLKMDTYINNIWKAAFFLLCNITEELGSFSVLMALISILVNAFVTSRRSGLLQQPLVWLA